MDGYGTSPETLVKGDTISVTVNFNAPLPEDYQYHIGFAGTQQVVTDYSLPVTSEAGASSFTFVEETNSGYFGLPAGIASFTFTVTTSSSITTAGNLTFEVELGPLNFWVNLE